MSTNPRRLAALTSAALAFAGLAVPAPSAHAAAPVDIQILGTNNPHGGAAWQYLGANVKMASDGSDALAPSWVKTMAGVDVGFIGAVTEELPSLVSPAGIAQLEITDIVDAVNAEADDLTAAGV